MTRRSLRLRLLLAVAVSAGVAAIVVGLGLVTLFERHVERRIGAELDVYLAQLAARVTYDDSARIAVAGELADPRFARVYGGLYWQVTDEESGAILRSRSLWDTTLTLPGDVPKLGEIDIHDTIGPDDAPLLAHERRLSFRTGGAERVVRFVVAIERKEIDTLTAGFARDVAWALGLLLVILLVAGWLQVNVGLRPLDRVREGLSKVRQARATRLDMAVPDEIGPLVDELNALLAAQEESVARARDRAADLAHGFKTPLTALFADIARLRKAGETGIADDVEATALMMQRNIDRELVRSRQRNQAGADPVDLQPAVESLVRTLKRTPRGETLSFETPINRRTSVRIDRDDLNEILGNLMDNAVRHARSTVRVVATPVDPSHVEISVCDDGPGVDKAGRDALTTRGVRLDRSGSGAGLGLAIVNDILDLYGARLGLATSTLGGLEASFVVTGSAPGDSRT